MAEPYSRIGIYGGTFDPVHTTHLDVARAALDAANLDVVFFVVAARPPHKRDDTWATPEQRFAMVEVALDDEPNMRATDLELHREGPSYTSDTLSAMKERHPGAELYLIIGMDSLVDLPKWHDPKGILRDARLLVVPRPGLQRDVPDSLNGKYDVLPFEKSDVSSTDIRKALASGTALDGVLPKPVEDYIRSHGIYLREAQHPPGG